MTQPSVSMQIRQLEDNLGVALFEQLGRRVYLTEAGQELYRYGRAIDQQLSEAETVIDRLKGLRGGQLRLAIGPTAKYFMLRLLAAFVQNHPDVTIDLHITGRDNLLAQLDSNERDLIVLGTPPPDPMLVGYPFLEDPLVVIAPPGHPLTGRRVPLAQLAQEPFLMREPGSDTREVIDQFFAQHGIEPRTAMVINSNEAIKQGVQAGLGLAIVPTQSVAMELETGRLVVLDIDALPLQRAWYLAYRRDKRFSNVAEAFKDFVEGNARHCIESCALRRLPHDIRCLIRQPAEPCPASDAAGALQPDGDPVGGVRSLGKRHARER